MRCSVFVTLYITSVQLHIVLNDCHQTVSAALNIYLYSNSILCSSPKSFLILRCCLSHLKKQLYLPAIFIKVQQLEAQIYASHWL